MLLHGFLPYRRVGMFAALPVQRGAVRTVPGDGVPEWTAGLWAGVYLFRRAVRGVRGDGVPEWE